MAERLGTTVARLLAPGPWGLDLQVDELIQWKALRTVQNEERSEADDNSPAQLDKPKRVVTNPDEIHAWFNTA